MFEKKLFADEALQGLVDAVSRGEREIRISGLNGSSPSLVLSLLAAETGRKIAIIASGHDEAKELCRELSFFLSVHPAALRQAQGSGRTAASIGVFCLPAWELAAGSYFSSQRETEVRRMEALYGLVRPEPAIVIIPLESLLQAAAPRRGVDTYLQKIAIGDTIDRDALVAKLEQGGYRRASLVEETGDYSVRGHVIDIFTSAGDSPFRLLFMGDELESIREFDPVSQRSVRELVDFALPPAREYILSDDNRKAAGKALRARMNDLALSRAERNRTQERFDRGLESSLDFDFITLLYEGEPMGNVTDYIGADCIVVLQDPPELEGAAEKYPEAVGSLFLNTEGRFHIERDRLVVPALELLANRTDIQRVGLQRLILDGKDEAEIIRFRTETDRGLKREEVQPGREQGLFAPVVDRIRKWMDEGDMVLFLTVSGEGIQRLSHLFNEYLVSFSVPQGPVLPGILSHDGRHGRLVLREGRLRQGFRSPGLRLTILSEEEIFGRKARRRKARRAAEGYFLRSFAELKEGDFVVHVDHGIGIYNGLRKLKVGPIENDFLILDYLESDRLYIPVDRLDQIQRYIGPDGHEPKVDKLGGNSWDNMKQRVRRAVEEIAQELVALYATREITERRPFAPKDKYYEEFASTFDYEETPDQAKAIDEVDLDLAESKPMDRLICGDAGFGKTEVALRAAFRAAMEGKQTAVLVPTTILAEQHYQTFAGRLAKFPVRVEALNRFKTKSEQKQILEDLALGKIDILIGTHRILQKDVAFRNLGLVVVDEEQRFGVSHKERLKKLRTQVDVLTLSATPIPRTLQLSLVGLRDLSIINTAPQDRLAIQTRVIEFDENLIRKAVLDEINRGGQVFFVHDRVRSIYAIERFLKRLVPEAKIIVAHGQMKSRELEEVMVKFVRKEYNTLLCTTIIGSGIDIPAANTIIINRADRFGLSQLYQLRGRVGRSKERAYAHLVVPGGAMLSRDAQKRLDVIREFTEPGSGLRIASQDLEIRGAGNLLGQSQSGQIAAVGYELYLQLIEKTIREIKGERETPEEEPRPEIHLGIPAFIPEDYVADMHRRLMFYKRISLASDDEEIRQIRDELQDCYGPPGEQLENLLEVIRIRNLLKGIRAKHLDYNGQEISLALTGSSPVDPEKILKMAKREKKGIRLSPDLKLHVPVPDLSGRDLLREVENLVRTISPQARATG